MEDYIKIFVKEEDYYKVLNITNLDDEVKEILLLLIKKCLGFQFYEVSSSNYSRGSSSVIEYIC